jgi:hypothetical protein
MIMKNMVCKLQSISILLKFNGLILALLISIASSAQDTDVKGQVRLPGTITQTDEKGQVNSLYGNPSLLGNTWQVTECCGWSGTWTRRPNTNTFDAVWRHTNGAGATGVVELRSWNRMTNEVTIYRQAMNGYYKAIYNPAGRTLINGTTTWYPAGQGWSAVIR